MARSFPPDVLVLDSDSLVHARVGRGRKGPQILQAKSYRIAADAFTSAVVTPDVANEAALAETLRRLKMETGRWDKASLLLPDGWFRINILEMPNLPERRGEADQVIRWSLKRTMPIPPESLRIAWEILSRSASGVKILVVSAVDKTLATLERLFAAAGIEIVLIEPVGLNIWNAVAVREPATTADRLFLYLRDTDFTTAVFRGGQPLFIRSRNLTGDRTIEQEIRLSASYLRDTLRMDQLEHCYVAGNGIGRDVASAIGAEFGAPVRMVELGELADRTPGDVAAYEAELTACTGVFTG
jgi:Tfp pilus assembly PilM family ATPase